MRYAVSFLAVLALCLGATQAQAKSCSAFAVIKSYDAAKNVVEVDYEKGKPNKYFPRPEGSPTDSSKIPSKCKRKVTKQTSLAVKSTGGRLSMTQVRTNFEGKMLNDTEDPAWLANKLKELVAAKTTVVIVVRPGMGKDAPLSVTTVYMPVTDAELAEIKRLEDQAEDA